jgi:hypothetical protein
MMARGIPIRALVTRPWTRRRPKRCETIAPRKDAARSSGRRRFSLHVHFQLAEPDAAASEPSQVTAAQLGETRTIDPLDELLIVLGAVGARTWRRS